MRPSKCFFRTMTRPWRRTRSLACSPAGNRIENRHGDPACVPLRSPSSLPRSGGISAWLDGCCLFVRVAALHEVGLLDERYFLYCEDAAWTVRASRRGWLNAVVLDASARHKLSRSTGSLSGPVASFYFPRTRYLLLRTHRPLRTHSTPRLFYALTAYGDYRRRQSSRESRRAVLEAYWSLLRNRWGAHAPCRHRRLLALAAYLLLSVTATGSLTRRLRASRGTCPHPCQVRQHEALLTPLLRTSGPYLCTTWPVKTGSPP
jgi:GT2 family glycosyltransferase